MVVQGFSAGSRAAPAEARYVPPASAALPQLSCIDDLAGDAVLSACEKTLFGSAESAAAAVAYAANQITLLISLGDVATANKGAGSDLVALRRAVERDRYGLMAYVLTTRDRCTPQACPLFRSLTNKNQIAANMDERVYENLVTRYAPSWNAPPQAASGLLAGLPPVDAHRQADQRRIPDLGLDAADQHHESRAAARRRAQAATGRHGGSVRAASGPARSCGSDTAGAGRCQEAAATTLRNGRRSSSRRPLRHPQLITTSDLFKARAGRYIGGIMPLHLIKLAVGCESVKELKGWVAERMATAKKKGLPLRHVHVTRMTPKRDGELLAGGSLYWVIKGEIAAREKIIAIEPFRDKDGIGRCRLVMQPKVFAVSPRPMRPFQGWRYLTEDAVPPDLTKSSAASVAAMPEPMRRELRDLGLL